MNNSHSFISYLQTEKIHFWQAIAKAMDDGLISIDEDNDTVTDTNLLLLNYPELHKVTIMLVEMWIKSKTEEFNCNSI